jgi:4-amino-4-deoxy-L-arabinose transferase-like glycosyltransferase
MMARRQRLSPPSVLLAAILLLGAALRLWGFTFGLPNPETRPDETALVGIALLMTYSGLNPHFFHWPSLEFYVLAAIYRVWYTIGRRVLHVFHSNYDLFQDAAAHPSGYLLVPRIISVGAGVATIWIVYRVTRDLFDRSTALVASFLLAIAFLHVRDSHFGLSDVPMTFLVLAAMVPLSRLFFDPARTRDWMLAGALTGLAASTKYNGGLMVAVGLAIAAIHVATPAHRRAAVRGAGLFVACSGLAFVAGTPFSLLDFSNFAAGLRFDSEHLMSGHGVKLQRGWIHHLTFSLRHGLGTPLLLASIGGMLLLAVRSWKKAVAVCAFPVLYYLLLGRGYTVFVRYIVPVVPFLCITAAVGLVAVATRLTERSPRVRPAVLAILVLAVGTPSMMSVLKFDRLIARADTRLLALQWLDKHRRADEWIDEESPGTLHSTFVMPPSLNLAHFDAGQNAFLSPDGHPIAPEWVVIPRGPFATYMIQPEQVRLKMNAGYTLAAVFRAGVGSELPEFFDRQDMYFVPFTDFSQRDRPGPDIEIFQRTPDASNK